MMVRYEVTATLPDYNEPFVLDVPAQSEESAKGFAMYALMAQGFFEPPPNAGPEECLAAFFTARALGPV